MSCCGGRPYCGKEPEKPSGPPSRAQKILGRWAEPGLSAAVAATLLYYGAESLRLGGLGGWVLVPTGAVCATWSWIAWAKALAGGRSGGAGVVVIEERRVTYMGPQTGGAVSLDELRAVDVESGPHATWILREQGGPVLRIPAGAEGVSALPEALAGLPGFSEPKALRAVAARDVAIRPVWRRLSTDGPRPRQFVSVS